MGTQVHSQQRRRGSRVIGQHAWPEHRDSAQSGALSSWLVTCDVVEGSQADLLLQATSQGQTRPIELNPTVPGATSGLLEVGVVGFNIDSGCQEGAHGPYGDLFVTMYIPCAFLAE